MQRAQQRMETIAGAEDLLKQLLHYVPSKRISMRNAIEHEMFSRFK